MNYKKSSLSLAVAMALLSGSLSAPVTLAASDMVSQLPAGEPRLLTDPYLQNPTKDTVSVVWITNFAGKKHTVLVEQSRNGKNKSRGLAQVKADTVQLERLFEDANSKWDEAPSEVMQRQTYRHEAVVKGLQADVSLNYWIVSKDDAGNEHQSGPFHLQPLPSAGEPLQILMTSDQQERFNSLANYQKVEELFPDLDAIFFAGDMTNHPRRGSEWFDNYRSSWNSAPTSSSPAFFPSIQGTFQDFVPQSPYRGGKLLQNVPLFTSVANHEVSGRFRPNETYTVNGSQRTATLNNMFGDAQPRWYAKMRYNEQAQLVNPGNDSAVKDQWIKDNSNDFEVYRDLFTLPDDGPEGEAYYSKKIGDVMLISMNVSRIWRSWSISESTQGKFVEMLAESNNPDEWGFGEHIFTPFAEGTKQHRWLKQLMKSQEFKDSKYRVVMFHQSSHGLGDNAVPVLTDPVMHVAWKDENGLIQEKQVLMPQNDKLRISAFEAEVKPLLGSIEEIRYEYPLEADHFRRDVEPLLQANGVQLVLTGHSHVWNRTKVGNLNMMETSNVGNCYGAYMSDESGEPYNGVQRAFSADFVAELELGANESRWNPANYPRVDDAHGRKPIYPTLANPMVTMEDAAEPVPYVCSNNITTFSILDTAAGMVRSYAFDVREPNSQVVEFDRFPLTAAE